MEIIDDNDLTFLQKLYQEVFLTMQLDIDEHSDEFTDDFLQMFKLFGLSSAFKKFQTKEDLLDHEDQAVITFANKFTTCTLNEAMIASKTDDKILKDKAKEVVEIIKTCYIHSHTKSCRKYQTECRYGIPRFPIWKTIVSKPMKATGDEGEKLKRKYCNVLKNVKELLTDKDIINNIIEEFPIQDDINVDIYKENRKKRILKTP